MKALVCTAYGLPGEVLRLKDEPTPVPSDDEVLVSVRASSVNAADIDQLRGSFMIRMNGPSKPKYRILGSDIAGEVLEVGTSVTEFRPGDEVFGDLTTWGFGAFAERVCVPAEALVSKPVRLSFEEAAAIPTAGTIALLNLETAEGIHAGQKVLVIGAAGGMGTFAVQIAKHLGAEVTGVDRGDKLEVVRRAGAEHALDYEHDDFARRSERYGLILDVAAHHSILAYIRALAPGGTYRFVGGSTGAALQAVFLGPIFSALTRRQLGIRMVYPKKRDLLRLKTLVDAGAVNPMIDRSYGLSETASAMQRMENGSVCGKVVIRVFE